MATIEIEAPDGSVIEFPDTMTKDDIAKVMARKYAPSIDPTQFGTDWRKARAAIDGLPEYARQDAINKYAQYWVEQERKDGGIFQSINDHVRMAARNVPFVGEYADELNALTASALGGDYDLALAADRATRRAIDAERRPGVDVPGLGRVDTGDVAKAGGLVGGALATPLVALPARLVGTGAGAAGANAAATAGLAGFADASGASEGDASDRAKAGLEAGVKSALMGYGLGYAGSKIMSAARTPSYGDPNRARSSADLKREAQKTYKEAEKAQSIFSGTSQNAAGRTFAEELQHRANTELADLAFEKATEPKVWGLVAAMQEKTGRGNISFKELERFRTRVGNVIRDGSPTERLMALRILGVVDDMLDEAVKPNSGYVLLGNAKHQLAKLKRARSVWNRMRKTELVEDAIKRAADRAPSTGLGANLENATRQEFRRLITNPKTAKAFSSGEREAIEQIVQGTASRNVLRLLGALDPTRGALNVGGGVIAGSTGSPLAWGAMGAGFVSRRLGESLTQNEVNSLLARVSSARPTKHFSGWQRGLQAAARPRGAIDPADDLSRLVLKAIAAKASEDGRRDDGSSAFRKLYGNALQSAQPDLYSQQFGGK